MDERLLEVRARPEREGRREGETRFRHAFPEFATAPVANGLVAQAFRYTIAKEFVQNWRSPWRASAQKAAEPFAETFLEQMAAMDNALALDPAMLLDVIVDLLAERAGEWPLPEKSSERHELYSNLLRALKNTKAIPALADLFKEPARYSSRLLEMTTSGTQRREDRADLKLASFGNRWSVIVDQSDAVTLVAKLPPGRSSHDPVLIRFPNATGDFQKDGIEWSIAPAGFWLEIPSDHQQAPKEPLRPRLGTLLSHEGSAIERAARACGELRVTGEATVPASAKWRWAAGVRAWVLVHWIAREYPDDPEVESLFRGLQHLSVLGLRDDDLAQVHGSTEWSRFSRWLAVVEMADRAWHETTWTSEDQAFKQVSDILEAHLCTRLGFPQAALKSTRAIGSNDYLLWDIARGCWDDLVLVDDRSERLRRCEHTPETIRNGPGPLGIIRFRSLLAPEPLPLDQPDLPEPVPPDQPDLEEEHWEAVCAMRTAAAKEHGLDILSVVSTLPLREPYTWQAAHRCQHGQYQARSFASLWKSSDQREQDRASRYWNALRRPDVVHNLDIKLKEKETYWQGVITNAERTVEASASGDDDVEQARHSQGEVLTVVHDDHSLAAEDLIQTAIAQAQSRLPDPEGTFLSLLLPDAYTFAGPLDGWLMRVAMNHFSTEQRKIREQVKPPGPVEERRGVVERLKADVHGKTMHCLLVAVRGEWADQASGKERRNYTLWLRRNQDMLKELAGQLDALTVDAWSGLCDAIVRILDGRDLQRGALTAWLLNSAGVRHLTRKHGEDAIVGPLWRIGRDFGAGASPTANRHEAMKELRQHLDQDSVCLVELLCHDTLQIQ